MAFLCVLEHFKSIETHFSFENFYEREARNALEWSKQEATENASAKHEAWGSKATENASAKH